MEQKIKAGEDIKRGNKEVKERRWGVKKKWAVSEK